MMHEEDWQQECREFDALLTAHGERPLPPGARETHFALMVARMRAKQAEIKELFAEAAKDPAVWARLNKPL